MSTPTSFARSVAVPSGVRVLSRRTSRAPARQRPAAAAASSAFAAAVLLAAVTALSLAVVLARAFASWQLAGPSSSHEIVILGQRLSYPAANAGAIVVLVLAGLGLLMAGAGCRRLTAELLAYRRFRLVLAARSTVRLDDAWVIQHDTPQAFCAGLLHPRVYLSSGALALLDAPALAAVLAHERHHALRRDPLRLVCARSLAAALFFVPALARFAQRQAELAELSADEAAVLGSDDDGSALARAMLRFSQADRAGVAGIATERVDCLLGGRPQWRFPAALCLCALAAGALCVGLAVLAARAASGSLTLAPPLLSAQPCILVSATLPLAAVLATVAYARARRPQRRP